MSSLVSARLRNLFLLPILVLGALMIAPASSMAADLEISPLTWDVIGLDSNDTSTGPNLFPVGAKVCNNSGGALTGVQSTMNLGAGNTAIALDTGASGTDTIGALANGECASTYFTVSVARNSANWLTNRAFTINASADQPATVATPSRALYVQKLISQNRNTTVKIAGAGGCTTDANLNPDLGTCDPAPTSLAVGGTYTYKLYTSSATAYDQVESFLTFPGANFRVEDVSAAYELPTGATFPGPYADACGWTMDGLLADFGSCTGPIIAPWISGPATNGKAGGNMVITYTVKVVGGGSGTLTAMVYDYSGSSFHYNSDYGDTALDVDFTAALQQTLTAAVTAGQGTITSNPSRINCDEATATDCVKDFDDNSTVTLTATPKDGYRFLSGSCPGAEWVAGTGNTYTCTVTMDGAKSVSAAFEATPQYLLTAAVTGGTGTLTSAPSGIDCNTEILVTAAGNDCYKLYDENTVVVVTATPGPGQLFSSGICPTGWQAVGNGTYTCTVTMSEARRVTAAFVAAPVTQYPLTVAVTGSGSVTGSGVSCTEAVTTDCAKSYDPNTVVTLTATPAAGYRFDSGTCPGTGWTAVGDGSYTCVTTMDGAKTASASFAKLADPKLKLTVKTSKKAIKNGQTVKVTGTLKNIGELTADNTQVCLDIPKGFVLVSYGKGGKVKNGQVCWKLGDLDPDQSKSVWMKLRAVRDSAGVSIPGTATAANAAGVKGKAKVKVTKRKKKRPRPKPPTG